MDGICKPGSYKFIDVISDGIVVLRHNLIVDINKSAIHLLGGEKQMYQDKNIDACIHTMDKPVSDILKTSQERDQEQYAVISGISGKATAVNFYLTKFDSELDFLIFKAEKCYNKTTTREQGQESYLCENWYKTLIDFLPDALFVTYDGEYVFTNEAGASLLAVDHPDILMGRKIYEHLHPEYREVHEHRKAHVLKENSKLFISEQKLINEKKETIDVEIISAPLLCGGKDAVISLVRDITKSKEAEQDLKDSEDKYQKLVELCPDAIFILDEQKINFANKAGIDILNAPDAGSLVGRNFIEFAHPDFLEMISKRVNDIYNKDVQKQCFIQNKLIAMDGTVKDIEVLNIDFEHKGKKLILNMVRDITERRKSEGDRLKLEEAIAHDNLKTEFFSNVSHELKTPLNIILGALQLITSMHYANETCPNFEKCKSYFQIMKQNCYRLLRLINNLIDITRIDSGFLKINYTNGDIIGLVEDIVNSVEIYTRSKGIKLTFHKSVDEQIIAYDPDKIERVILNLLSNAIKFNRPDGSIDVSMSSDDHKVYIAIKDTGVGIPEDMIDIIFERFRQVDDLFTRKTEGSGIGLSLVKSILNEHGGNIKVESEVGKGSEFIIELPKTLVSENNLLKENRFKDQEKVERINIEFSDIYSS